MPWRPLPAGGVAFAICVHPFRATHTEDLPLQIGDNLYIIEEGGLNNEWCRGYLIAPPSLLSGLTSERGQHLDHRVFTGIFPRNCVEVREFIGENKVNGETSYTRLDGFDGTDEEEDEDLVDRRKSQVQSARRLSKAVVKKRSITDVLKKDRVPLADLTEPLPRDPNAPKPLAPVPLLRVGDANGQSVEEPLVDEIASCIREWHDARLHNMLLTRENVQFGPITELIKRLDVNRKQLQHDVMTTKELAKLRLDTVWDLVAGNKMMNNDIIVRCSEKKGRILTAADSVIETTRHQANMSILDGPPKAPVDLNMHYYVLVDIRNIISDFNEPCLLQMELCTKNFGEKPRVVTEMYSITLPLPDTPSEKSGEQPRTLFVDLSSSDIGLGSAATEIYVVFKLIHDEPVRQISTAQPVTALQHKASATTLSAAAGATQRLGSIKGRRSVFGSQKKNNNMMRQIPEGDSRPATGESDLSDVNSSHSISEPRRSRDTKTVKRTVGVGAIEIGKLARGQGELATNVTLWTPAVSADEDRSDETDDWSEIIRETLRSTNGGYSRIERIKEFEIFVNAFASTDVDSLYRNNTTQLYNVHMTQKIGFSGVPTDKRSDIYLTLAEPLMGRNAALQHSKFGNIPVTQRCQSSMANLQLTLEVRKANGERIENCVFTASNQQGHTAWRTTGVERGEAWNQTIKLVVPTEDVPGSHVVMSIADAPNFPFALAWIPLWEFDAFVRDGDHQVALYVYDEYSSSIISGKGAYLALPPWHDKKNEPSYGTSATISVRTFLCSTEFSQDPTLLGLLNWRNFHGAQLVELLERFSFVPEIEIVKLLKDIMEALFQILHEYANSEIYEDIVFYNFVVIMSIVRDRRFNLGCPLSFAPTLHDWPLASQSLINAYQRLASNPMDPDISRKLRATLKVGDGMLRLIVETKKERPDGSKGLSNGEVNGHDERHPDFEQDLQNLFVALMALMRNPMAILLGTQTLVVQHFHTWLPELVPFMTPSDLLEIATNLLDACAHAKGKMILYRLILILNYSHLDIFKPPEVRTMLIANTFHWLEPYWGETVEVTDQWRDQVRLCCSVVAAQMEELGDDSCQYIPKVVASYAELQKVQRTPKKTFSMLFPSAYPFPFKATSTEIDVDEAMMELSALLAAAITIQQRLYFDANQIDVPGVLLQALEVEQSVLSGEAFPQGWLSLHVSHHRFAVTALERLFEVMVDLLPDSNAPDMTDAIEFDTELWRAFFDTLFTAVSSSALAMETFPEQKRRAVWNIAGDVRETGADLIRRSWNAIGWELEAESRELYGFERMGGYQVQFVPELIPSIVKLCLSVHAGLRNVAIEVLRSMIISTWEIDQDLAVIQSAMVDCLDRLCHSKEVTETMLQTTFIDGMVEQFHPLQHSIEDSLYNAVVEMFGKIEELLNMLTKVHQIGTTAETTRIVDTLRLMEFLRDVNSEGAYIRYVHQLAELQVAAGNHTEAGLALKMHADRYDWNPATRADALNEPKMPAQTAFERKESLYFEICQHFERSQAWEPALVAYRELAQQYEHNVFDFSKLARSQRSIASIHERIAKGDRVNARYFRVVYKGLGFSHSLRDKEFIFEGSPNDRLATFEDRLQQYHPSATVLRSSTEPDVEGQFLHVYPVSSHKNLDHAVYQRMRVSQAAREHVLMSNPQKFTFTSRQPQHDVPITEQVVEKVIYTTAESFPTLLRRSEIVRTETVTLSPIQAAVERTTRKTQELLVLEKRISSARDDEAMSRLSDELLLSVDPDSDSSVSRYRALLPRSEQGSRLSGEVAYSMIDKENDEMAPMQNALNVALLDHALAIKRCLSRFTGSEHAATKAELVPRFEDTFERELAVLFPQKQSLADEVPEHSSLHDINGGSRTTPIAEREAVPGAPAESKTADEEPQPDSDARRSRRRSIPFLKRMASSSNTALNGTAEENDNGRQSRQRSRSRSRQRAESLTRRLSFFRSGHEDEDRLRSPSINSRSEAKESNGVSGGLKKRLSFLRAAGRSGLTASGDAY